MTLDSTFTTSETKVYFAHKTQIQLDRTRTLLTHTNAAFRAANTVSRTLHTIPTHFNHFLHVTGLCFWNKSLKRSHVTAQKHSIGQVVWDKKRTWCSSNPS